LMKEQDVMKREKVGLVRWRIEGGGGEGTEVEGKEEGESDVDDEVDDEVKDEDEVNEWTTEMFKNEVEERDKR
jgi:hypothetical protein